jgi:hypothetical protein
MDACARENEGLREALLPASTLPADAAGMREACAKALDWYAKEYEMATVDWGSGGIGGKELFENIAAHIRALPILAPQPDAAPADDVVEAVAKYLAPHIVADGITLTWPDEYRPEIQRVVRSVAHGALAAADLLRQSAPVEVSNGD